MTKEMIRDPKTGKLREITKEEIQARNRAEGEERRVSEGRLRRQENMDRMVMKKSAADKLYPTMRKK